MAWVFEKSPTWRKIVGITKRSPLAMAGFTAVCFGGPYAMAKLTMNATNPEMQKEEAQKRLSSASLHQKVHPHLHTASSCMCARDINYTYPIVRLVCLSISEASRQNALGP